MRSMEYQLDDRFGGPAFAAAYQSQFGIWGQRVGWPAHFVVALLYFAGAAGPIATVELLPIPLLVLMLIRVHATRPLAIQIFQSRFVWLFLAAVAWGFVTLTWSADRATGIRELGNARWLWCIIGVTSIMHRRAACIAAIMIGLTLGLLAQGLEAIGLKYGFESLVWPHPHNPLEHARISGWWHHPVMGGVVLAGGLGLFLPCAVFGTSWRRIIGILGSCAVLAGIFATGTRGAWIASACLLVTTLIIAIARLPRNRAIVTVAVATSVISLSGIVIGIARGDAIASRFQSAWSEVRSAWKDGDFDSDTGARIQFALRGIRMISERPILGYGAGGYQTRAREMIVDAGGDPTQTRNAPGAHNGLIHAWATLGLPGIALLLTLAIAGIIGGLRLAKAQAPVGVDWMGTFGAGPSFALLGLLFMTPFEGVYTNVQPAAFASALLALCAPGVFRLRAPRDGISA